MFYNSMLDDDKCLVETENHKGLRGEKNYFPKRGVGKVSQREREGFVELESLGKALNGISRKGVE